MGGVLGGLPFTGKGDGELMDAANTRGLPTVKTCSLLHLWTLLEVGRKTLAAVCPVNWMSPWGVYPQPFCCR